MDGGMHVRVMTDEQIEVLRRQIAAYGSISEHLIDMYKSINRHPSTAGGMGLGNLYSDTPVMSGRQRWTPTLGQLEVLERIFEQENGSPSKQRIKEITSELSQHGQITESNVYNWFQNRRSRSKRKQTATSSNVESEVEADIESSYGKRSRPEKMHLNENQIPKTEDNSSQSLEVSSEAHCEYPEPDRIQHLLPSIDNSNSSGNQGRISFYENAPSNSSMNQQPDGRDGYSMGPFNFLPSRAMM